MEMEDSFDLEAFFPDSIFYNSISPKFPFIQVNILHVCVFYLHSWISCRDLQTLDEFGTDKLYVFLLVASSQNKYVLQCVLPNFCNNVL